MTVLTLTPTQLNPPQPIKTEASLKEVSIYLSQLHNWLGVDAQATYSIYQRTANNIGFLVHKNGSTQSISNNSETKVTWSTTVKDNVTGFNVTDNRYIVQATGSYRIFAMSQLSASLGSSETFEIRIKKNNTLVADTVVTGLTVSDRDPPNPTNNYDIIVNPCLQVEYYSDCNIGDYFEVYVYQNSGGSADITGTATRSFFSGYIL